MTDDNYEQVFNRLSIEAEQGNAKAQFGLACMYLKGLHVEKNDKIGMLLLTHSANQGYFEAKALLKSKAQLGMAAAMEGENI